jgi:hypothetical protein
VGIPHKLAGGVKAGKWLTDVPTIQPLCGEKTAKNAYRTENSHLYPQSRQNARYACKILARRNTTGCDVRFNPAQGHGAGSGT